MINYQDFSYNGSNITFSFSEQCVMINATKMARVFGKFPADWLRQKSAKEYIDVVSSETRIPISHLVIVKKGNNGEEQGTWMHKDVALEFARWLSPKFGLWCNRRIEELLTTGKTELNTAAPSRAWTPEMEAKIQMADAYIESDTPCSLRSIAQQIMLTSGKKITRSQLVSWLYDNGYLQKDPNIKYCPTQWAIEMGYFMIKVGRRQIRKDRTPRNGTDKGVPTPLGAMHLINLLSHCMPVLRERRRSSIS